MFSGIQRRLSVEDRIDEQFKTTKPRETKFRDVDLNQAYSEETQSLYDACKAGNSSKVKSMLSKGGNPNWYNNHDGGITALHCAAKIGACDIVELLLNAGADTSVVDIVDYNTPLHMACIAGKTDVCKQLLEKESSVEHLNRQNAYGNTPLHEAATAGATDTVKFLLSCEGIAMNSMNHRHSSPLMFALYSENCTNALLSAFVNTPGIDLKVCDDDGVSLAHICALKNNDSALKVLLSAGVDATMKDKSGRTALFYADIKGNKSIVSTLESAGIVKSDS